MIKFNMYNITDTETGLKVKVHYSHGMDVDGKMRVWIYESEYTRKLFKLFDNAVNESESMTDYFEKTRVSFFEDHPYYNAVVDVITKRHIAYMARMTRKQKKAA